MFEQVCWVFNFLHSVFYLVTGNFAVGYFAVGFRSLYQSWELTIQAFGWLHRFNILELSISTITTLGSYDCSDSTEFKISAKINWFVFLKLTTLEINYFYYQNWFILSCCFFCARTGICCIALSKFIIGSLFFSFKNNFL